MAYLILLPIESIQISDQNDRLAHLTLGTIQKTLMGSGWKLLGGCSLSEKGPDLPLFQGEIFIFCQILIIIKNKWV